MMNSKYFDSILFFFYHLQRTKFVLAEEKFHHHSHYLRRWERIKIKMITNFGVPKNLNLLSIMNNNLSIQ